MPTTLNTTPAALVLPDPADATNAVAPGEIPDIRGLKDVVDIPTGNEWLWWLLVAAAALVVAGVAAWFVRRHLARRSEELAPPPPPPPHVVAWERLQRALGLIHEAEQFCMEVSQIIRVYLEGRFNLHAPDRTTEEFLLELQSSQRLAKRRRTNQAATPATNSPAATTNNHNTHSLPVGMSITSFSPRMSGISCVAAAFVAAAGSGITRAAELVLVVVGIRQ